MNGPEVQLGCVANLWSRQMHFVNAGDTEQPHDHCFDHLTLLAKGSLRVTVGGQTTDFNAPHMIYIQARKLHTLVALEDDTVAYCIHALRDKSGEELLDPSMIPAGVSPMSLSHSLVVA